MKPLKRSYPILVLRAACGMGSIPDAASTKPVKTTAPAPIPPSELPLSSSPSLSLQPATLLERRQCWHLNAHSWRGPLTIDQYIKREALLERQLLTQDGQITYWILTDESLPDGNDGARPILASCETLRKEGYLAKNGRLRKLVTHGIGSVFCRDEYRSRGYASRMMTELGARLETWQQPPGSRASFSLLWSDIGPRFYAAHGWRVMSSKHITFPPLSVRETADTSDILKSSRIQELTAQDLQSRICPRAIAMVEAQLQARSEVEPCKAHIAIRPDYEHMAWHHARENFLARTLHDKDPNIKGAEDTVTGCAIIWSRVHGNTPNESKLHILHTLASTGATGDVRRSVAALLFRAQREANDWDMRGGVELWSPAPHVIEAAKFLMGQEKVEITLRDKESIGSLRWVGCGGDVGWIANEKYAWC